MSEGQGKPMNPGNEIGASLAEIRRNISSVEECVYTLKSKLNAFRPIREVATDKASENEKSDPGIIADLRDINTRVEVMNSVLIHIDSTLYELIGNGQG